MSRGPTTHWTIMKRDSTTFNAYLPQRNGEALPSGGGDRYQVRADGSVFPVSGEPLDVKLARELADNSNGAWKATPSNGQKSVSNMKKYRNPYNDRARDGFKFWYQPKPKPTQYGKYGFGGYKTVLGLGDAVRS